MNFRLLNIAVLLLSLSTATFADEVLRLRNSGGQEEIEFLFRATGNKYEPMQRVTLTGKEVVQISLSEMDPFVVMIRFPPEEKTGTLHTCFSKPINLRALASTGKIVDLRGVPAMGPNGDRQITYADLTVGGSTVAAIRKLETATEFSKSTMAGSWRSIYTAIDGSKQQSIDNFERRIMNGNGFQGKMSDVLVVEKEDGIEIIGTWSALGDKGEFQLFIDKQRPDKLAGHYTQDGDPNQTRYDWTATKIR